MKRDQKETKAEKKAYRPPTLERLGTLRQFTRTTSTGGMTDGGSGLKSKKTCIAPVSAIEAHRLLIEDSTTQEAFRRAIFETVRAGDVVLDLGTGSGIHALFACQAGAARVHAIEDEPIIDLAAEIARRNGFADRITFHRGLSPLVELPEPVDVIVGNLGFLNTLIHFPRARAHYLKPGGKLIPSGLQLAMAPVTLSAPYDEKIESWSGSRYGLDFSAFRPYAANHPETTLLGPDNLLATPAWLAPIDLAAQELEYFRWRASFTVERDGILHAIAGWYRFFLAPGVTLSTEPPLAMSPRIWSHPYLPLEKPLRVEAGMPLELELILSLKKNLDGIWKWKIAVDEHEFEQSNFRSVPLDRKVKRAPTRARTAQRRAQSEISQAENHRALAEEHADARV